MATSTTSSTPPSTSRPGAIPSRWLLSMAWARSKAPTWSARPRTPPFPTFASAAAERARSGGAERLALAVGGHLRELLGHRLAVPGDHVYGRALGGPAEHPLGQVEGQVDAADASGRGVELCPRSQHAVR